MPYIKEYILNSGQKVYSPWITYEEKGLFWGWNKREHPLCYDTTNNCKELSLLQSMFELSVPFYKFITYHQAKDYIDMWKREYDQFQKDVFKSTIISERIIKNEDMQK